MTRAARHSPSPPRRPRPRGARIRAAPSSGPPCRCDLADGGDDVGIGPAAAEIAAHELADLFIRTCTSLLQQCDRRHDLTGSAVAALKCIVTNKRRLYRMQLSLP